MSRAPRGTPEDLAARFDRAALVRGLGDPALSDPGVRRARRILDARRAVKEAECCPVAVVRRVEGWFAARPRGSLARVLDLVLDSGRQAVPALRGSTRSPRLLRCAGGGATVDLQVQTLPRRRDLHLAVSPAVPGMDVEVRTRPHASARRVRLDAAGAGRIRLPAGSTRVSAVFRVAASEAFRIGPLDLA